MDLGGSTLTIGNSAAGDVNVQTSVLRPPCSVLGDISPKVGFLGRVMILHTFWGTGIFYNCYIIFCSPNLTACYFLRLAVVIRVSERWCPLWFRFAFPVMFADKCACCCALADCLFLEKWLFNSFTELKFLKCSWKADVLAIIPSTLLCVCILGALEQQFTDTFSCFSGCLSFCWLCLLRQKF